MSEVALTEDDRAQLSGERGEGAAMAMRMIVALARILEAPRLLDIASAHIDGCSYHGLAGLEFAERLAASGARVRVPTTLNVSSLDLMHPGIVRLPPETRANAKRLTDAYAALGARTTWTCAPYQTTVRPERGSDIAWAESNAIVFANSVLGARTERYGDFIDVCAAITGRAPAGGLHLEENRRPRLEIDCSALPGHVLDSDAAWAALGHALGRLAGSRIALLRGIPPQLASEDRLKALGAAAASSGQVALFHIPGVTPEATPEPAGWGEGIERIALGPDALRRARDELTSSISAGRLDAVSLGTPHFSLTEFAGLTRLLADGVPFHPDCQVWVSTSREVLAQATQRGDVALLERAGGRIVVDTCTYITPILSPRVRTTMTTSGKWAWYAPNNLGVGVVFGTLGECVASARAGRVVRDDAAWS